MHPRLASRSHRSRLHFHQAEITGLHHHAWLPRVPTVTNATRATAACFPKTSEYRAVAVLGTRAPYRVGPGDLHRVGDAVGRIAGLSGPPRLCYRLCRS